MSTYNFDDELEMKPCMEQLDSWILFSWSLQVKSVWSTPYNHHCPQGRTAVAKIATDSEKYSFIGEENKACFIHQPPLVCNYHHQKLNSRE